MAVTARAGLAALAALVAAVACATPAQATFPGRNGDLVFTSVYNHGPGTNAISLGRVSPRTGATRAELLCNASSHPDCITASAPTVSPDGSRVALLTIGGIAPPSDAGLRVVPLGPGTPELVDLIDPFRFAAWFMPRVRGLRWLPTGDRLSVQLLASDSARLTTELALDGALGEDLLPPDRRAVDWAIDGRAAFIHDRNLHVALPNGAERRLTGKGADQPSWSPRGKWIAFTRDGSLFVVPANGGKARRLTRGSEPVWAPDGRSIAFLRRGFDRRNRDPAAARFYLYSWRTKQVRQLTPALAGEDAQLTSPDWQPLPR